MFNEKEHFYHETIRRSVAVFGTLFNALNVIRKDSSGKVLNMERVPLAYGPRQRYLERINEANNLQEDMSIAIKLPRMSFELTALTYDANTKMQKMHNERFQPQKYNIGESKDDRVIGPVMYRLGFELNIYAKNQDDALQILEQILPYFQPQYTVTVKEVGDRFYSDYPFVLQGVTLSDSYEGDFQSRRLIMYTLGFETRVRFYGPLEQRDVIKKATGRAFSTGTETELDNKTISIIDPWTADEDETHTIVTKIFNPDVPNKYSVVLDDLTTVNVGDYLVGTINGSGTLVESIDETTGEVILSGPDGVFEDGEVLYSRDKLYQTTVSSLIEIWP